MVFFLPVKSFYQPWLCSPGIILFGELINYIEALTKMASVLKMLLNVFTCNGINVFILSEVFFYKEGSILSELAQA